MVYRKAGGAAFQLLERIELFKFSLDGIRLTQSIGIRDLHRKKIFLIFPSPAGMSLPKLSLGENYDVMYKLFLPRESLVSDIRVGTGISISFFYGVLNCKLINQ
jgi:hypothetical protein